jgi:hypothetical protein
MIDAELRSASWESLPSRGGHSRLIEPLTSTNGKRPPT